MLFKFQAKLHIIALILGHTAYNQNLISGKLKTSENSFSHVGVQECC
jgi:hypothetical protein